MDIRPSNDPCDHLQQDVPHLLWSNEPIKSKCSFHGRPTLYLMAFWYSFIIHIWKLIKEVGDTLHDVMSTFTTIVRVFWWKKKYIDITYEALSCWKKKYIDITCEALSCWFQKIFNYSIFSQEVKLNFFHKNLKKHLKGSLSKIYIKVLKNIGVHGPTPLFSIPQARA